jgi:hypothetical protein
VVGRVLGPGLRDGNARPATNKGGGGRGVHDAPRVAQGGGGARTPSPGVGVVPLERREPDCRRGRRPRLQPLCRRRGGGVGRPGARVLPLSEIGGEEVRVGARRPRPGPVRRRLERIDARAVGLGGVVVLEVAHVDAQGLGVEPGPAKHKGALLEEGRSDGAGVERAKENVGVKVEGRGGGGGEGG